MAARSTDLTILFIKANPSGTERLDTDSELRELYHALGSARHGDPGQVKLLPAAQVDDLLKGLWRHEPDIVHFAGHGNSYGGVTLNAASGVGSQVLSAEEFAETVRAYQAEATRPLRLVVLAGCRTAEAARLLTQHVGCAIGTTGDVGDEAIARVFTPTFYGALANGRRSIHNALDSALAMMRNHNLSQDAEQLHLFSNDETACTRRFLTALAPVSLTVLHLEYLRRLFGKPWASVSMADMLTGRDEEIRLLDIYVPLQINFEVVVKTQDHKIVKWWAKQEGLDELRRDMRVRPTVEDETMAEALQAQEKLLTWPELAVDEDGLQLIVDGIQRKITDGQRDGVATEDGDHQWDMEAHDAASVQQRFVLLGDPGSGKSSFLRHLALCLAGELRRRHGEQEVPENASLDALRDWLLDTFTPVYIELRDLVRHVFPPLPLNPDQPLSLPSCDDFWRYVQQQMLGEDLSTFVAELQRLFASGEAVLLLDGLDEVPQGAEKNRRRQIKSLVASLAATYPQLRLIITSRPHAYRRGDWALDGFGRAELRPLSLDRLHELAVALFSNVRSRDAKKDANQFIDAVRQAKVRRSMRANPLFFTMLVGLWLGSDGQARDLPQTEAELYRESVNLLLGRWTWRRAPDRSVVETLTIELSHLREVLERLACTVQGQAEPGQDTTVFNGSLLAGLLYEAGVRILPDDLLDYLSQHAGILVSSAPHEFHFIHRSFQEHLAACELTYGEPVKRILPTLPDSRFPAGLVSRVCQRPDLWDNVLLLAADELLAHGRQGEFWRLLANLCQPLVKDQQFAEAAMLVVQISESRKLLQSTLPEPELDEDGWLAVARKAQPLIRKAAKAILEDDHFTPEQRDIAGQLLGSGAFPGHDGRPGVGLRQDGLPDIKWDEVPKLDAEGEGEWTYQDGRHKPLDTFWIARYPITYAQFQVFLDAEDGFKEDRWWEGLAASAEQRARWDEQWFKHWNHPRDSVSWWDAMAFCAWLTDKARQQPGLLPKDARCTGDWQITLPIEQQWEKAARGHDGRKYPWGGDEYKSGYANIDETLSQVGPHYLQKTSAVGMYPQGVSPYGVADLSGNVWEWCLNEYESGKTDPGGDADRVLRGGSWSDDHEDAASAFRYGFLSLDRSRGYGFRVVVVGCAPVP